MVLRTRERPTCGSGAVPIRPTPTPTGSATPATDAPAATTSPIRTATASPTPATRRGPLRLHADELVHPLRDPVPEHLQDVGVEPTAQVAVVWHAEHVDGVDVVPAEAVGVEA